MLHFAEIKIFATQPVNLCNVWLPVYGDYGEQIEALYNANKEITIPEIVEKLGCSTRTAQKWLKRVKVEK